MPKIDRIYFMKIGFYENLIFEICHGSTGFGRD